MYLKNVWYVAGWAQELSPGSLIARKFLDQPVALFCTEGGHIGAVEDRCSHRAMALSKGCVAGEAVRCAYHGLEFATDGRCVHIPSQDKIPDVANVRAFPLESRDGILWIWMGDPALANTALIPAHPWHSDPRWAWKSAHYDIKGNWQLLIDNLLDLSHLPYIHAKTIGGNPELHFKTKTVARKTEKGIHIERHMPASVPPPTYVAAKGFKGLVDRWQEIDFEPVLIRIHTGACDAGTGAYDGHREHGLSMLGFHGITPETETTTHYFWSMSTNQLHDGLPDLVFQQTADTFKEDQEVIEIQQERISAEPDRPMLDIANDVGGRQARLFVKKLFAAEAEIETAS